MKVKMSADEINAYLYRHYGSADRINGFFEFAYYINTKGKFWEVFCEQWCEFDDTWDFRSKILLHLIKNQSFTRNAPREFANHFRTFKPGVKLYRGCSRERIMGLSWTRDKKTAAEFARGHRGIATPDPVLAEITLREGLALAAIHEREEDEMLLNFKKIDPAEVRFIDDWRDLLDPVVEPTEAEKKAYKEWLDSIPKITLEQFEAAMKARR